MYLFIFEDGQMNVGDTIADGDYQASDDGILDIVKTVIEGMDMHYEQYHDGEWHRITALAKVQKSPKSQAI